MDHIATVHLLWALRLVEVLPWGGMLGPSSEDCEPKTLLKLTAFDQSWDLDLPASLKYSLCLFLLCPQGFFLFGQKFE